MKKILLFLTILLLSMGFACAALDSGLNAPDEFEKSEYWDKNNIMDIYSLKGDNNTRLEIEVYKDSLHELLESGDDYQVTPSGEMFIGIDKMANDGYVFEVVEFNGEKYLVNTYLADNPSYSQVKDSIKYLEEFNKLNNVAPVEV